MVVLFPLIASGEFMAERSGPGCTPCDPSTDFEEVFLVPNWEKLPHKCQEESRERVNEVNSLIEKKKWSYVKPFPVLACLSFAASTIADWWAIEYGWAQESYENFYHGRTESGFNPRELEVAYLNRSRKDWSHYPIVPVPDLVHKRPFPASNRGYARVLSEQNDETLADPILPSLSYSYSRNKYPIESTWLRFTRNFKSNDRFTRELISIIRSHGPMLTHIEYNKLLKAILPAVHGVVIVGYGKPSASPDETVFIFQDSYGDHPKDYGVQAEGGASYKYLKARYLESVIVFPHKPTVTATRNGNKIALKITNKAGRPLKINQLAIWDQENKKALEIDTNVDDKGVYSLNSSSIPCDNTGHIKVYVAADFYMESPMKGYWLKIKVNRE